MIKLLIYPFDLEFCPIARHASMMTDFCIGRLVSPNGWGYTGRDAGYVDGGEKIGLEIECDFDKALCDCDALFVVDSLNALDFKEQILPKIYKAAEQNKKVFMARQLSQSDRTLLEELVAQNKVEYQYGKKVDVFDTAYQSDEVKQLDTPVVFVLGNCERTSKFEIQLAIREELLKLGYRISQVGSRENCDLLGFHSLPSFMSDKAFPDDRKIVLYNNFLKYIELTEAPDIIIIGIPGGVMPINNRFTNHFGLKAFEISQAVTPDYAIFSSQYENYTEDYFGNISTGVKKRLEFDIDCHILSNSKIDWSDSDEMGYVSYLTLDSQFVSQKISQYSNSAVYNIFEKGAAKRICENLVQNLSEYAYVKSI